MGIYMLVVQSGIPGREGGSIVKITIAYIPDEEEAATTSVAPHCPRYESAGK